MLSQQPEQLLLHFKEVMLNDLPDYYETYVIDEELQLSRAEHCISCPKSFQPPVESNIDQDGPRCGISMSPIHQHVMWDCCDCPMDKWVPRELTHRNPPAQEDPELFKYAPIIPIRIVTGKKW